jgi:hypothetical protein
MLGATTGKSTVANPRPTKQIIKKGFLPSMSKANPLPSKAINDTKTA